MMTREAYKSLFSPLDQAKKILVGYSGGLDSHVLLHLLSVLFPEKIMAIHVNHGWSAHAAQWEEHCEQVCKKLKVEFKNISVDAKPKKGESPENTARQARYAAFEREMKAGDFLVTAHQQDDQAETLLLQLFRGAGVKGLAGMPVLASWGVGYHFRPLLSVSRAELEKYAKQQRLKWIEDESNSNIRFDRSYLRQTIMPLIKKRWPAMAETISRSSQHCAEAAHLLDELAKQDLKKIKKKQGLLISSILKLSLERQNNLLRYWLHGQGYALPSEIQLQELHRTVLNSRQAAMPKLSWGNVELRRYRDVLIAAPLQRKIQALKTLSWDLKKPLKIAKTRLYAKKKKGVGVRCEGKITVRFRQQGERFHVSDRQGSHPLKKLFQEWGVPPWERDQIPLIYVEDELVAVVGYGVSKKFLVSANEMGWSFELTPEDSSFRSE